MSKEIKDFIVILRELQKIDNEFPIQYARCLSEIALDEGLSLTDLADRTDMPLSTISRIISALSKDRAKGRCFNLVFAVINKNERRKKELFLTPSGKKFINNISNVIFSIKTPP